MSRVVYFVQGIQGGPVKIGTTKDIKGRIRELQVGCADHLVLLGSIPGGRSVERQTHKMFASDWIRGEWFRPSDRLIYFAVNGREQLNSRDAHLAMMRERWSIMGVPKRNSDRFWTVDKGTMVLRLLGYVPACDMQIAPSDNEGE